MIVNKNDFGVEEILDENIVVGEVKNAMLKSYLNFSVQ